MGATPEPDPAVKFRIDNRAGAVAAALLSATLMGVAECQPGFGWLALAGMTPLCLTMRWDRFMTAWLSLATFGAALTAMTGQWIRLTAPGFVWLLVAAIVYQAALAAIPAAGVWAIGRRVEGRAALLFLPVFWVAMELLERHAFFGISWALAGLPLADYAAFREAASIAGPEALSFAAVAVSIALALIARSSGRVRLLATLQGAAILVAVLAFGYARGGSGSEAVTAKIAVVQPVIAQETRWDRTENRPPLLQRMNRLIDRAAAQSPRLIVLPEGSLPGLVHRERDLAEFVTGAVERTGRPLLFGSVVADDAGNFYNAAIRIGTDGTVDEYRKRKLVPFAERTPWPFGNTQPDGWVKFTPGSDARLMPLNAATSFGVAMCLEDTYPDLARDAVGQGASFLIALVNTESFKETSQPLAHLRRAQLTAAAAGIPILRAANSGVSCSLDAHGRILAQVPENREAAEALPVAILPVATLYGAVGDGGVLAMLAMWFCSIVFSLRLKLVLPRARRRRRSTMPAWT